MSVHSDKNLGGLELFKGMFNAVSDVGSNASLRLNLYVRTSTILCHLFEKAVSLFHVSVHMLSIIDYIQGDKPSCLLSV